MKYIIDDLKEFFARETATVNENTNKNFDELTQRLEEMDRKFSEITNLADDNKRQTDYLLQKKYSLNTKVEEQDRIIWQLEEQIEDQMNRNIRSTLVIRVIKHKNTEKKERHRECSSFCGSFGQEQRSIYTCHRQSPWSRIKWTPNYSSVRSSSRT